VRASATADRIRAAADLAGVARQVEESLVALDPEARPDDLAAVAEISVLAKTSPLIQARSHVEHLGLVVKEANDRVEEARRAARLLQGVRLDPLPCDLDGQDLAVVASLESVVAGERRLDQALICDAQRVLGKVQTAGARLYLREQVRQIMEANGYQVEGDFTTLRPGIDNLTLTRPDWAEHHLRLVLSDDKLSYVTLRDYQVQGDAAALLDRERCAQSGADISLLVGALRSRGVDVETVATRDDPPVLFLGPPPKVVRTTAIQAGERGQASLTLPDEGGSRR
jgi:hypothetical protein